MIAKKLLMPIMLCLKISAQTPEPFALGIENIPDTLQAWLRTQRVGLITNQSGKDQRGRRTLDLLISKGIPVIKLLAPEHGVAGAVAAGKAVGDTHDAATQLPIVSLYGEKTGKKIDGTMLADLNVLMIDIQDVGMRHFTYISTLRAVLEAAAEHNKYVIVCDRPNPLGHPMEGPLVEPHLISFISAASIPLRHGMTIGELARYFNNYVLSKKAQLCVIPMKGYTRSLGLPEGAAAHISPNITNKAAAHGYSFLGLLGEIRPLDVGMGTDQVFTCICLPTKLGIPDKAWGELSQQLAKLQIQTAPYTYYSTRKKQQFRGLALHIPDINACASWNAFLHIVAFFKQSGVPLECSREFDKAAGSDQVRQFILGSLSRQELEATIQKSLVNFANQARQVHLY